MESCPKHEDLVKQYAELSADIKYIRKTQDDQSRDIKILLDFHSAIKGGLKITAIVSSAIFSGLFGWLIKVLTK